MRTPDVSDFGIRKSCQVCLLVVVAWTLGSDSGSQQNISIEKQESAIKN
jgi:hypothetical protein